MKPSGAGFVGHVHVRLSSTFCATAISFFELPKSGKHPKRAFHAITRGLRYVSGLVDTSDAHETKYKRAVARNAPGKAELKS